jgi:hypothetical protein
MTDLSTQLLKAQDSSRRALSDLDDLITSARSAQEQLADALHQAERAGGFAQFNPDDLATFLDKPYLVRPLGEGKYELIVPRFIPFHAGWPIRHADAYSIYLVTRFIHFISPLPDWLAADLGFTAPTFGASLEGNTLTITRGDPAAVAAKLGGSKVVARRDGNRLILRPASRFDILRRIIRDEGFLPFTPQPIPDSLRRAPQLARTENGSVSLVLRAHQQRDFERFLATGAVSVFAYPQTGKSYLPLQACAELAGPKLILAPRRSLVEQWQARLGLFLTEESAAEVTVTTYQGARKYLDREWTLVVFDEAHHMPADFAVESAALVKAVARIGLSATPRREDGNEDLIPALCGYPVGMDWPVKDVQKPSVTVWIVPDEAAKLVLTRKICERPADGKTFIFTFRLAIGEKAAKMLHVPFVSGQTKRPLPIIDANDTVVISSIGNEGLSFPVRRVVELDFLFGSGMEAGQRLGRLAYEVAGAKGAGEHHVLMTSDEYQRYSKRLLIYEQWGLDISIKVAGGTPEHAAGRPQAPKATRAPAPRPAAVKASRRRQQPETTTEPADEVTRVLAIPAIAAKIERAKGHPGVGERAAAHVSRIFRLCYSAAFSPTEIAEGLGQTGSATVSRYRSACKALVAVRLLVEAGEGRYTVNQAEVQRLKTLSGLAKR